MIDLPTRMKIVERLGPYGNMVADLAGRFRYPVSSPPELARYFANDEKIEIGATSFQLSSLCLSISQSLFPINSLEDLISKLEKADISKSNPSELRVFNDQQPMVGYHLRNSKRKIEILRREGIQLKNENGAFENLPDLHAVAQRVSPVISPVNPERNSIISRLGPLGEMVIDLSEELVFPVRNQSELATQFQPDEHIMLGPDKYSLSDVVVRLPDNFFPIASLNDLYDKLFRANIREIHPYMLRGLFEKGNNIGLLLQMDENRLKRKTENRVMSTGGPEQIPEHSKIPEIKDTLPLRADTGRRLGLIGDLVYDLAEQIKFPVATSSALAANFKEKDALLYGPKQYSLARLALKLPQELFPLRSFEELVDKLDKAGLKNFDFGHLITLIESDKEVRYTNNYKEEDLKNLTQGFHMQSGGPETPPPPYRG